MVGLLENPTEPSVAPEPLVEAKGVVKRIKRIERPNKAVLDEDVGKVFGEVDLLQKRIQEIKDAIDTKQQNRHAASPEVVEGRNKLSDLITAFRATMDERRALRDDLDQSDKLRDKMRLDARAMKEKLLFFKLEQIDEETKKLEYRMSHTSLTLPEEKKLLQQVKELGKSRELVKEYNDKLAQIGQDEASRGDIVDKIKKKDAALDEIKAQQDQVRKLLAEMREKIAADIEGIPILIEERNAVFGKIKALRDEARELRAEFRTKEEEYWERERQWKEAMAIQKRKDYDKREAERKERDRIRKERDLENYVEPYTNEIIMVEQLTSYLLKYVPAAEESVSTISQKTEIVAPKGVGDVLISKKNKFDEETDAWFSGKGKGKKAKAPSAPKNKGKEKLSLSLDALSSFEKVKLAPPTTFGDVCRSIDELKLKKEEFTKLQKEARERRERGEKDVVVSVPKAVSTSPRTAKVKENGFNSDLSEFPEARKQGDLRRKLPENVEDELTEDLTGKLPEDLESELPGDLDTKLADDLEAKLPEDLDTKLPEDIESGLADDLEPKLSEDIDIGLPEDLGSKLPESIDSDILGGVETKLPEDLEGNVVHCVEAIANM